MEDLFYPLKISARNPVLTNGTGLITCTVILTPPHMIITSTRGHPTGIITGQGA
jgi:hypothetical protein